MSQQISQAYIEGIKEGRAFLNRYPNLTHAEMLEEAEEFKRLMRSHSDDMKDLFKGQRDFWLNQIKKAQP